MAIIEPVREDIQHHNQIKKNSAALRLWHWANAIVISGSLLTVLANSIITNQHKMAAIMQNKLQQKGAAITPAQAKFVAHAVSDSVWDIHRYFGYGLAVLLLFRLILEFFQVADQKFIRTFKSAYRQFTITKKNRQAALHEFTVKGIYLMFYALLIIMVITGLSLAFDDDIAALKPIHHTVKSVHGFCMYLILGFIVLHLGGVFLAERKKEGKGIVSDMINGG
jgi:Ni/Fe-hydrogenase 1 B-type cytochrome subunit